MATIEEILLSNRQIIIREVAEDVIGSWLILNNFNEHLDLKRLTTKFVSKFLIFKQK